MKMTVFALSLFVTLGAEMTQAGDLDKGQNGLARTLETPSHQSLISRRGQPGTELSKFRSDGCSGGLSSAWRMAAQRFDGFEAAFEGAPPWEFCCVIHDRAYHTGMDAPDSGASYSARLMADQALRACVARVGVSRRETYGVNPNHVEAVFASIAGALYWSVRFGGGPCTGLGWRWGFGYPDCAILFGGNN